MIDFKLIDDSEELNLQLLDDNEEIKLEMTDYDDTEVKEMIDEVDNKVDNLSTQVNQEINEIEDDIDELDGRIRINTNNISNLQQTKADESDIPDVSDFITKDANNLTYYELKTNTGSLIDLEINDSTYVVTLKLKNSDGTTISTDTIDLPLESVVVGGSYDSETKEVVLSLEGGSEVRFSVADLVSGLQSEITSSNKLASDLVDDNNSGNKFVTTSEKQTWNGKANISDIPTKTSQLTNDSNYVTNTDYANTSTGGVIKVSNANAVGVSSIGTIFPSVLSYLQYTAGGDWMFIGKGTLENVITGKGLINSSSDITGNASTSTTLKSFSYSRKGTNYTWAKVATASLVGTWEEKHAYLFVKGTHNSNFKQNGIISIDVVGNGTKAKVNSYSAQFISASADLNVENFYIEYQDGDANTNATINFWVKNTTNTYASWQFKILQNTGWTIESAETSVATLPTQDFTGKISELNNKTLKDKDGNDISTTYVKNTDYATTSTAGVIKLNASGYGTSVDPSGALRALVKNYEQYESSNSYYMIGKGTLENVITGKNLINSTSLQNLCLDTNSPTPNFENMTPIATYEFDVSDSNYHPIYTLPNSNLSYSDTNIVVAYRITTTGTGIYDSSDIIDIWHNPASYPLTTVMHRTLSTSSGTTGVRYLRAVYPTSTYLNNSNYPLGQEICAYNSDARHIKVEVFKMPLDITWKTSADSSIYVNSTYNGNQAMTLYNVRGWIYRQPQSFIASSAGYANYVNAYECAIIGPAAIKSGNAALAANHFVYLADDGLVYDISNTTKNISANYKKVGVLSTAVAKNTAISSTYFKTVFQLSSTMVGTISHDTFALGRRVFLRCTMDANGNIHSDNYLATSMGAGYTWLPFGVATASNAINMDTRGQHFYTLDSNGKLTHLDGIEIATGS